MFRFFKHRRWLGRGLLLGMVPLATAGCHGHGYHRAHDDMSEEEMQNEVRRGVQFVLDRVDASDAQVQAVTRVLQDAVPDMRAFRQERKALSAEMQIALRKQNVDRDELEQLRVKGLDLADRVSVRGVALLADVADELSPEQRANLVALWKRRAGA